LIAWKVAPDRFCYWDKKDASDGVADERGDDLHFNGSGVRHPTASAAYQYDSGEHNDYPKLGASLHKRTDEDIHLV
jgi:hypothetical protein